MLTSCGDLWEGNGLPEVEGSSAWFPEVEGPSAWFQVMERFRKAQGLSGWIADILDDLMWLGLVFGIGLLMAVLAEVKGSILEVCADAKPFRLAS